MKVTGVRIGTIRAPLRVPFKTALRTRTEIESVLVAIETNTGAIGYGEAPPTGVITGDTKLGIIGAVREHIAPAITGREIEAFESLTSCVEHAVIHNSSAKAAVDMALWDLYGQQCCLPVHRLLGSARTGLVTDITISVNTPDVMIRDTLNAVARGYDTLKVKVGIDPELDVERLLAVRKAAPNARIRIDANQAWRPREAVRILNRMQELGLGIELVEQPVLAENIEGLKYVRDNSDVPVLADESLFSPKDALEILRLGAADMLNIKLMKCGGITQALRILAMAEVTGTECMMGCMLETKVAVNAAVHVACARQIVTRIDLDGPVLCSYDPVQGGAVFNEKNIMVSDLPGLGITGFDSAFVRWHEN
ncbi:MAG: dipeptide epimerase [Clostridia bacterium]|nr:dipeptide epimerase [Clostridia bacterium]